MNREDNLIPLTDEMRRKGSHARSLRKATAARLNPIKHGRYITAPETIGKSLLQVQLEKAFLQHGKANARDLTRHLLESLALVAATMEAEGVDFQRATTYSRLILDVTKNFGAKLPDFQPMAPDTREEHVLAKSILMFGDSVRDRFSFDYFENRDYWLAKAEKALAELERIGPITTKEQVIEDEWDDEESK